MRRGSRGLAGVIGPACALLLLAGAPARGAPARAGAPPGGAVLGTAIAESTWVDHDRQPTRRPPDWAPDYWGRRFHQGVVEPLTGAFDVPDRLLWLAGALGAHPQREAVNVNAFDEVPNSAWFTNRNHLRPVPVSALRQGPDPVSLPAKPWTITHAKRGGWSAGFQIEDADGRKWLVKLDSRGYPQLSSGADMVARTLLHAAGYNVPHNEPVRFVRGDLAIDADLVRGAEGERFTPADLDSVLVQGAVLPDGGYLASASLFVPGHVLGAPSMDRRRPGDANDWYSHPNRRELRGLFVLCAWIDDWDTEEHQSLDAFVETRDSLGHVEHYLLDTGSSFGASATGPKQPWEGHENVLDLAWMARRFLTLGFVEEPWRRTRRDADLPSAGSYESEVFRPGDFRPLVQHPAFRRMTDRDGYWGAKIVASFSDAQIAAAVDAAHYDDPRARDRLVRDLVVRREKIARHWFGRVAPLDFFSVQEGVLRFHDLAVDVGLTVARTYEVRVGPARGRAKARLHLAGPALPLEPLGSGASRLSLEIAVAGSRARPAHVELAREGPRWVVTRVRHG